MEDVIIIELERKKLATSKKKIIYLLLKNLKNNLRHARKMSEVEYNERDTILSQ